jgi:hypothetical protein
LGERVANRKLRGGTMKISYLLGAAFLMVGTVGAVLFNMGEDVHIYKFQKPARFGETP